MTEDHDVEQLRELERLRVEHRKLDREIFAISKQNPHDSFTLFRLKKQKLSIRDQISTLEETVYPDIIA